VPRCSKRKRVKEWKPGTCKVCGKEVQDLGPNCGDEDCFYCHYCSEDCWIHAHTTEPLMFDIPMEDVIQSENVQDIPVRPITIS